MKNKKDLLDALDDPGSLSQEELDAILDDPKELEDARLLGDYRQAFVRCHASLKPDVNKEWNNFRQSRISGKNRGKQLWIGISIGVAASVLLFSVGRCSIGQPLSRLTNRSWLLPPARNLKKSYCPRVTGVWYHCPHLRPTAYCERRESPGEKRSWITSKRSGKQRYIH